MSSNKSIEVLIKVRIKKDAVFWGGGLMTLLELVEVNHSLKKACESMQMSYSKGHSIIKKAEKELGHSLITSIKGGERGGGSFLSKEGIVFINCYREYTKEMQKIGKKVFQKYFQEYFNM
jgi:N-terminal domain of molybdenum-binding protein